MMKRSFEELSQGTVSYLESGSEHTITLLFFHGNSSCAESYHYQLSAFSSRFHCIAMDFLGHGESSPALEPQAYSFAGCAQQISEFIKAKDLNNVVLVGHSLGGHAANDALPNIDGVLGAVFVGAPPFNGDTIQRAFEPDPSDGLIFEESLTTDEIDFLSGLFVNREVIDSSDYSRVMSAIKKTHSKVRPSILDGLASGDFVDEIRVLQRESFPVLIIQGELDGFLSNQYLLSKEIKSISEVETIILPDCKHVPHLENPQAFNEVFHVFLKQHVELHAEAV
jgi:pimeloyl-ACP methyl ester carboxylesterase